MISVEEAQAHILDCTPQMQSEEIALESAVGRIASENVIARTAHPECDISAMDGYAFINAARHHRGVFHIIAEISADKTITKNKNLSATTCWCVFTGANVTGADFVVPQEEAVTEGVNNVRIPSFLCNDNPFIRKKGSDFHANETILGTGTLLKVRSFGLATSACCTPISVRRKPKALIFATGNELSLLNTQQEISGRIASSLYALKALIDHQGGDAVLGGILPDDPIFIQKSLERHIGKYDLIITTGGVSVGRYDYLPEALKKCGIIPKFQKIAMRPGKPSLFAQSQSSLIFSLPGNPVSSLITAMVLILPCLRKMLGLSPFIVPAVKGILGCDLPPNGSRRHYMRAQKIEDTHEKTSLIVPFDSQDSAMTKILARADGLLIRPPLAKAALKGDILPFMPFPEGT